MARGEAYVLDGAIYIKFWEMQINLQWQSADPWLSENGWGWW